MEKKYLQLDYAKGQLYEYSKDQKEDFISVESKTGKISFRKYYPYGIEGILSSVSLFDSDFGRKLVMNLEDGVNITFSLLDAKGNIDQFAEKIIAKLDKLNRGDNIKISPYNFTPEGSNYAKKGVNILIDGQKVEGITFSYYKEGKLIPGDVPAVKFVEDRLDRTKKKPSLADVEIKNNYLFDVLATQTERLKWSHNSVNTPEEVYHKAPPMEAPNFDDTLPF